MTSRAKAPGRLKSKVLIRNSRRAAPYKNMREIYEDIADLCGVRVSLYFPGDRDKADSLINDLFTLLETKQFPEQSKAPSYNKRFSGYWANHYRAHMREESLDRSQKKYTTARIEIQVASVLMHGQDGISEDERHAVEYFFSQWVPLEQLLYRVSSKNSHKVRGAFNINTLKRLNLLDKECINQIVFLRKIRNKIRLNWLLFPMPGLVIPRPRTCGFLPGSAPAQTLFSAPGTVPVPADSSIARPGSQIPACRQEEAGPSFVISPVQAHQAIPGHCSFRGRNRLRI